MIGVLSAIVLAISAAVAPGQTADSVSLAPLDGATVAIDPGHNGQNWRHPEAINRLVPAGGFRKACDTEGAEVAGGTLTEAAFNFDMAKRLRQLLKRAGARVVLTRSNNRGVGPCVDRRAEIANRAKADVAISIHADGGPAGGRGFHVIRPGLVPGHTEEIVRPSRVLALRLRAALDRAGLARANYIAHNGWIARRDLGGLNRSTVPKVFVELGNMPNSRDARQLARSSWRDRTARALRDGLAEFLAERR